MKESYYFDTSTLNRTFNISPEFDTVLYEEYEYEMGDWSAECNPFYGKKHTDETKQILREKTLKNLEDDSFRMSRANYGEKNGMYGSARYAEDNPMWGKTHSDKTRKLISEKRKEWFKHNESPLKGRPCSESTKKALSDKNSKQYKLVSPEGQVVEVKNLTQFARDNDLSIGSLQHVVAGRNKTHKGWKKYAG